MSVRGQCLVIFAFLIGALVLATLVAVILLLCFRDANAKPVLNNLTRRIKAWWVMVIVVGGAILAGRKAVIVLFAFMSLAALREFITLTPRLKMRSAVQPPPQAARPLRPRALEWSQPL